MSPRVQHVSCTYQQGVTKRCRLSWLTNSALVWAQMRREGGGCGGLSQWVQLCTWSPNKLWRSNSILNLIIPTIPIYNNILFVIKKLGHEIEFKYFDTQLRWKHVGEMKFIEVRCRMTWPPFLFPQILSRDPVPLIQYVMQSTGERNPRFSNGSTVCADIFCMKLTWRCSIFCMNSMKLVFIFWPFQVCLRFSEDNNTKRNLLW